MSASRRRDVYIFAAILSGLVLWFLLHRMRVGDELNLTEGRWLIWHAAVKSLGDYPWTGYGLGNFELGYLRYATPLLHASVRFGKTTAFAHSACLQFIAEWGWPLGLALSAAAGAALAVAQAF